MRTFDTPHPITASIEIGVGTIRLEASDRADTTVEVRPSDPRKEADAAAVAATTIEHAGGRLTVKTQGGWRLRVSRRSGSVDVVIGLPSGSHVDVDAGVASVTALGVLGDVGCKVGVGDIQFDRTGPLEAKTGVGDVTADHVAGRAHVVTGTGALRLGVIDGPLVAKNSNGSTSVDEITGEARVNAANGAITIGIARGSVIAKAAHGDVRIDEVGAGSAVAQSAFGELRVGVREGVAAWLDLHTKFGTMRNELDAANGPTTDDETVEIHAHTSFGDITIHRSLARGATTHAS